jgi:methionyl-tRNA synthetase
MKKPTVSYDTFAQLDFRVGEIMDAVPVEGSTKLLELTVDLGEDYGTATILSGIAAWYTPEQLKGKKTMFLANLEPRKMMGKTSEGMLVAIDSPEHEAKLLFVDPELANGYNLC